MDAGDTAKSLTVAYVYIGSLKSKKKNIYIYIYIQYIAKSIGSPPSNEQG